MEIFLLFVILVFVVLILNKQRGTVDDYHLRVLSAKIDKLQHEIERLGLTAAKAEPQDKSAIPPEAITQLADIESSFKEEEVLEEPTAVGDSSSLAPALTVEEEQEESVPVVHNQSARVPLLETVHTASTYSPEKTWFTRFKENNPDLEKFIGENLINKIGILILVLGISFFVKYAIDKDWINEPTRVGIGILAGAMVMGVAHRLRQKYAAFSSVFVGGAISIFYLTIGIAFHDYKLFSQPVAFVIMVVITLFGVFVSLAYNRKEIAIISLIGGFAVPFMVSTGAGNYQVLFTYIALLNVGMLIIAYFKKWNIVTLLAFIFTCLLYLTWFVLANKNNEVPYAGALFYATLMYLIFSVAPVLTNIKNNSGFSKTEYVILLSNTFFFFGIGASIFYTWNPDFKGLFTLALALYNFGYAFFLRSKSVIYKNLLYLLLGLALTFITLTIPFQFDGNYITLFWSCEAVLLLWFSQKSKIAPYKAAAIIVQGLMLISLFMDYTVGYSGYSALNLAPFVNKLFCTGMVSLASLIVTYYLWKKENETTFFYFLTINPKSNQHLAAVLAIILAYLVGILEISYQATSYIANNASARSLVVLYHFVFSAVLLYYLFKSNKHTNIIIGFLLASFNILFYIFYCYNLSTKELSNNLVYTLNTDYSIAFYVHYLLFAGVGYFIYLLLAHKRAPVLAGILANKFALWVLVFCIIYILSNEIMIHALFFVINAMDKTELMKLNPADIIKSDGLNMAKYTYVTTEFEFIRIQIIKIGFPILWGLLSFVFLIIGIKKQNKQLRIIALTLLGLTILKLFMYDIKNVSETGKIVAFILLGVLILIISFVYQKIKKLIVDAPNNVDHEENN